MAQTMAKLGGGRGARAWRGRERERSFSATDGGSRTRGSRSSARKIKRNGRPLLTTLARSTGDGLGGERERESERVVINGKGSDDFDEYGGDDLGRRSDLDLVEPKAVVVVGVPPEEAAHIRLLLDEIGGREYKVLQCNGKQEMLKEVSEVLQQNEVNWEEPLETGTASSSSFSFPAPGSPRLLLFCGLPRNEVDIVSAILDEGKFQPFAVSVVTRHNVLELLGEVVVGAVEEQKPGFKRRRDFVEWKDTLARGGRKNTPLRQPLFTNEASQGAFSDLLRERESAPSSISKNDTPERGTTPDPVEGDRMNPPPEETTTTTTTATTTDKEDAEVDPSEPREDEEKIAEGFFSKPLDMDGVRRDLAQDMEDDKAFMNPWYARGLKEDDQSTLDVVKEEERAFIQRCVEAEREKLKQNNLEPSAQKKTEKPNGNGALAPSSAQASVEQQEQEQEESGLDDIILNTRLPKASSPEAASASVKQQGSQDKDDLDDTLLGTGDSATTRSTGAGAGVGEIEIAGLSEEDILKITERFEDVDVESLLERFKQVKGNTED